MNAVGRSRCLGRNTAVRCADGVGLPGFIIIGAMKCGTTSLFRHLGKHPEIGVSKDKETDFFLADTNLARGLGWYRAQFPIDARVLGEASPNYAKCSEFPGVAERIRRAAPDARLIYMVRDPVERFVSQYLHHVNAGETDLPPERILESAAGRNYLDCSRYYLQLSEYLRFFPREQIMVVCLNELRDNPVALVRRTFRFLDVDPDVAVDGLGEVHNSGADLRRLPSWYFAARRSPLLRGVKQRLPAGLRQAFVAGLARRAGRPLPQICDDLRAAVRPILRADAARFRALTGRSFSDWSV